MTLFLKCIKFGYRGFQSWPLLIESAYDVESQEYEDEYGALENDMSAFQNLYTISYMLLYDHKEIDSYDRSAPCRQTRNSRNNSS